MDQNTTFSPPSSSPPSSSASTSAWNMTPALVYSNLAQDKATAVSDALNTSDYVFACKDGLILKCWHSNGTTQTMVLHGFVYLLGLCYLFVGVAIIADRFMASIEQITSQETDIIVRRPNGKKEIISVRIWNETVSNLTLMALGSSAPEIMLSIIEIYAQNFEAGELGPGTIVGSAAFNMFIIIGICVWSIPSPNIKKIKYLRVFIVTLSFSVFAYIWMLTILIWTSPGVIEVWEGFVTLGFFGLTVLVAYIADRRLLIYRYLDKRYRFQSNNRVYYGNGKAENVEGETETETETEKVVLNHVAVDDEPGQADNAADVTPPVEDDKIVKVTDYSEEDLRLYDDHREHIIEILKDVKARFPYANESELEALARNEIARLQPKSRAFYRIMANRNLIGGSTEFLRTDSLDSPERPGSAAGKVDTLDKSLKKSVYIAFHFDPKEYTVMEDAGSVLITVTRIGCTDAAVMIHYKTEDGTAKADTDYVAKSGVLTFGPGEAHKQFSISIINDDEFEEDEYFFIRLYDASFTSVAVDSDLRPELKIIDEVAKINILDDDHAGVFSLVNNVFQIPESIGTYKLAVNRYCGARGQVYVPYETLPGTAIPDEDFRMTSGELIFNNNETSKEITLEIINNIKYEKNSIFYVLLRPPYRRDSQGQVLPQDEPGAPKLGDLVKCMIRIRESNEFKKIVDNLMRRNKALNEMGHSWENQLFNAVRVHKLGHSMSLDNIECSPKRSVATSTDENEDGASKDRATPSASEDEQKNLWDYICHYVTLPWKIIFAFVPPPIIWNGWACFLVSIIWIGVLTSLINDLASHFGATVHLKDSITAISLVALGTSLPDTFASKIAAQNEVHADSSIGNVTGSNAVNVFLGIGLAWTVAAVYHAFQGTQFLVEPGSLSYSVTLYCICAFVCASTLMVRRVYVGGELGGPYGSQVLTVMLFFFLWVFYLVMSTLEVYGVIKGF